MDTSRDYYEDKIADYNRYRRGRNLYQFCKDEGIDYNWMLRAQRQFGGKGSGKKDLYLSIGVIWLDKKISSNFAVVNQHTESYDIKYTA